MAGEASGGASNDVMIEAPADPLARSAGGNYVPFGPSSGFGASWDLAPQDETYAFRIEGKTPLHVVVQ